MIELPCKEICSRTWVSELGLGGSTFCSLHGADIGIAFGSHCWREQHDLWPLPVSKYGCPCGMKFKGNKLSAPKMLHFLKFDYSGWDLVFYKLWLILDLQMNWNTFSRLQWHDLNYLNCLWWSPVSFKTLKQAFSTGGARATCGACGQSEWRATIATTKQKTERKKIYILESNTQLNQEVAVEFDPKMPA